MISYIKGIVIAKNGDYLIVENAGLGYKLFATPDILALSIGSECKAYTYLKISDDAHVLFGLPDFKSLQFFELLLSVNGVGPKTALAILSASNLSTLESAIGGGDASFFGRVSGVGKKTAERIILELKNKVNSIDTLPTAVGASDIYDALVSLGYSTKEARTAAGQIDPSLSKEAQLKAALKLLSK